MNIRITLMAAMLAKLAYATVFTYVPIPGTNNIQTALINAVPTGIFTADNTLATPFSISSAPGNCGPSGNAPCNYYDGFGTSGNGKSITLNVSVASPTDVYTLMNAYSPPPGQQLATITFIGTGGATLTFPIIAGKTIRDYGQGVFSNTLNNGIPGVQAINALTCIDPTTCLGSRATGNVQTGRAGTYVVDEQDYSLASVFAGQTLTQIVITDTYNGASPILLGLTVGSPGLPSIGSGGIISASAFGAFSSAAPGTWIEIYGTNLAIDTRGWTQADFNGINAPTSLDGTKVTIGGQDAFIDYISPGQVNALIPSTVATGPQPLTLTTAVATSPIYTLTVNPVAPGLLAPANFNIGGTQYVVAQFGDGTYVLPTGAISGLSSRPAKPGDEIVIYGIGFGPVTPDIPAGQLVQQANTLADSFEISIGGVVATPAYDGLAPNYTGLYQFNITVPSGIPSGVAPLTFTVDGVAGTQTLNIAVGN